MLRVREYPYNYITVVQGHKRNYNQATKQLHPPIFLSALS